MKARIGIDIGGTKWHARLERERGRVIDLVLPSPGTAQTLNPENIVRLLTGMLAQVRKTAGQTLQLTGCCIGLAGLDGPDRHRALLAALMKGAWWKKIDPDARLLVNDVLLGLRAGTSASEALVVLSGTGSNGYGVDVRGREAWASGRGPLLADEGSGYALGVAALHAACRADDGRGPKTQLLPLLLKQYGVQTSAQLAQCIGVGERREIAALNQLVEEAAVAGDAVAKRLLQEAADELVAIVRALRGQLRMGTRAVDTVLFGGTFVKNKPLQKLVLKRLERVGGTRAIVLNDAPVQGAFALLDGIVR